jgi:hypothetical protein
MSSNAGVRPRPERSEAAASIAWNVNTRKDVALSQGSGAPAGMCILNHMRTGEIVDLANERRLSAVLDFTHAGAELLILNGGSRAEEFTVVTMVKARVRKERRAAYCIDSGTSMHLTLPLSPGESPSDITLRVVGGHGEMVLFAPQHPRAHRATALRGWATLAAATVLLLLAGGRLDAPSVVAYADPEPAPADAPLVKANVSLRAPAELPSVVAQANVLRHPALTVRPPKLLERRLIASAPVIEKRPDLPVSPAPRMTDLRVPSTAKSGDFIPVSFGAIGRQVKIVASIGPTIISKTIVAAQHGVIAIRSPKSDRDSRIMTVRAYAQDGSRTSTLQALVVLVRT